MHEDEQRPGSNDIDHSGDSTAEAAPGDAAEMKPVEEPASVKAGNTAPEPDLQERKPISPPGRHVLPLVISGVVATIMTVAFIAGVESIFPVPASERAETTTQNEQAGSEASTPAAPASSDAKPAAPTTGDAPGSTAKPDAPAEGTPDATSSTPDEKTSSRLNLHRASGLLASLVPVAVAEDSSSAQSNGSSRPGPWGRFMILLKFAVLVILGAGCGLVALGGLALALDRPIGSLTTAVSQVLACSCLATLSLLVPSPTEWLLGPIHFAAAAIIFWVASMLFFRFSPRSAGMLLGATMALLAVAAIGSQVVVWATWS